MKVIHSAYEIALGKRLAKWMCARCPGLQIAVSYRTYVPNHSYKACALGSRLWRDEEDDPKYALWLRFEVDKKQHLFNEDVSVTLYGDVSIDDMYAVLASHFIGTFSMKFNVYDPDTVVWYDEKTKQSTTLNAPHLVFSYEELDLMMTTAGF